MTTFLIVDDIEVNLYMLKMLFEGHGYKVFQARNGVEALQIAQENPPDIIVSDILMPGMDGFALCREWKQDDILKKIPFVFYTATYTEPKDEEFALSLGAERFLIKPMETELLVKAIKEVLADYEAGELVVSVEPQEESTEYLQEYNEVLFRKLEQKVEQLEEINHALNEEIEVRKEIESALRDSEQQYSLLFNGMSDAFTLYEVIVDDKGLPHDYRFIKANAAFESLIGLKTNDVMGKTIRESLPALETRYLILFQDIVLTGQAERFEIYIPELDKYFEMLAFCPRENQFATIFFDTTERRRKKQFELEYEQLKASFSKERERNTLVQQIIAMLSHDLRTPLSVISTSKDMLKKYFDKLSVEKREEKFKTIESQIRFVLELLDDTVQMIRGNTGDVQLVPKTVNLLTLCKIIVEDMSDTYGADHQLAVIQSREQDFAILDETLISRIIMNLLTNAIKYSAAGSEIRLELDENDEWIIIQVVDKGIGISADDLPYIFDPLYRMDSTKHLPGSGLGLSIVKDCVERHHGRISIESVVGEGSTFIVELPIIDG